MRDLNSREMIRQMKHQRRHDGGAPWMGDLGPGPRGRGRRPRVRRGDVRAAILDVLARGDGELNGYQVIQDITERSDGAWRPSPGSVYPTISQLEDEGLVETGRDGGRKVLALTEAGRAHVAEHADELAAVWRAFEEAAQEDAPGLRDLLHQTVAAVGQVGRFGTPDQRARAAQVLTETRRSLYGILADGPDAAADASEESASDR